jgi:glycosyltransferase involved in cell wall biosynthesis
MGRRTISFLGRIDAGSTAPRGTRRFLQEKEMKDGHPSRILITGGHELGGVASFAEGLRAGFAELGIPVEIVPPSQILAHWRELRDPRVLKILSTSAVFAAPLARRAICVAHGFPRADVQGWTKVLGIVASYKLATWRSRLAAVSQYAAVHLRSIFNLRVDAIIHNPLNGLFLAGGSAEASGRDYLTYAGRLHPCKGLDQVFPALCTVLGERESLRVCLIGEGELRPALEAAARGNARIEFTGPLPQSEVRAWLRRTRVFVSGCETEALGICYLEALSQGCAVVMPACGGGVEIAPELIGSGIHLFASLTGDSVSRALRNALAAAPWTVSLAAFSPRAVAEAYLAADERFHTGPMATAGAGR